MRKFTSGAQQLARFLDIDDGLNTLLCQVTAIQRIERIWQGIVPAPLLSGTHLGQVRAGVLHAYCSNAATAGKLRQLAPKLVQALAAEHICVELIIKVRIVSGVVRPPPAVQRSLSTTALKELTGLHADLPEGTLKHALEDLLKHAAKPAH